jgi:hypothetical protein
MDVRIGDHVRVSGECRGPARPRSVRERGVRRGVTVFRRPSRTSAACHRPLSGSLGGVAAVRDRAGVLR